MRRVLIMAQVRKILFVIDINVCAVPSARHSILMPKPY